MYYIDGNNLEANIHPKGVSTPQAEQAVIELLERFVNQNNRRNVTLVFDGVRPPIAARGKLRIVYPTPSDKDADNAIVRLVKNDSQRGNAIVVTGDRELIQRVRALGAQVKDRIEFLNSIPPATTIETKPRITSRREVDEWLQIFEIPPERADQGIIPALPPEPPKVKKGKRLK